MCAITKIENLAAVKKTGSSVKKLPPPPPSRSSSGIKSGGGERKGPAPAFDGARFDKSGYCLKHPAVQLVNPMKDESGKLVYQELRATCPTCQSLKHRSKKTTSLGGGKVRTGHRVHGTPSNNRGRSSSRSRSKSREPSLGRDSSRRSASKSRERGRPRPEYDTPFDSKGRCHHHKNVQLAAKKQFGGGWKVLHSTCPKCMEDKFEDDVLRGRRGSSSRSSSKRSVVALDDYSGDDDRSVRSSHSRKSTRSSASASASGGIVRGNANGRFDKNGCCELHTHIQVAKKRVFGSGWKVVRACPACDEGGDGYDDDDYSVKSGRSTRSNRSTRSSRSARSAASSSRGGVAAIAGKATKSGRYGSLPFDGDGYCCLHPNVQLAKKKTLGGFKILHDVCPECAADGSRGRGGSNKPRRRKSGTGRVFDDSGSETSSFRSGRSSGATSRESSPPSSSSMEKKKMMKKTKKRIRVRNLKTTDEDGKAGRYSGYVNDDHRPHGRGSIAYEDGTGHEGVWNDGAKAAE